MNTQKEKRSEAQVRQLTISRKGVERRNNRYVFFPSILLSGRWLAEAGFEMGQIIDVSCEQGRVIITPAKETWEVICSVEHI